MIIKIGSKMKMNNSNNNIKMRIKQSNNFKINNSYIQSNN